MKVKKYIGILIATMLLAGLTACGGGSDSNDPINPEKEPELPADYNPMEGMWISVLNPYVKEIFTKEFQWKRSFRVNNSWTDPVPYRSYKIESKNRFRTSDQQVWSFTITEEYPKKILTLTIGGKPSRFYRVY